MSGMLEVPGNGVRGISRRLSMNRRNVDVNSKSAKNLDDVVTAVGEEWRELVTEDSNTLEVALSLMDNSSIGKAKYLGRFQDQKKVLEQSLKAVVNDNHQGFNSSIGSYRSVVQGVSNSQNNINSIRELLVKARNDLATRRPVLKELRTNSLKYQQMIQILESIDKLNSVSDEYESLIAQKYFYSAHNTLDLALKLSEKEGLASISALSGIQEYLVGQETSVFSILIEELHNHLYLKSPYCDDHWNAYTQGQAPSLSLEQVLEDKIKFDLSEKSVSYSGSVRLDTFLASLRAEPEFRENLEGNPEEDSFYYIRLIVEVLGNLNRLPSAFEVIKQRLPSEVHKLVEKTIAEVGQRFPKPLRESQDSSLYGGQVEELDFGYASGDIRLNVLKDLTWTLYSKLTAVLQAHRVVYEVVNVISQRHVNEEGAGPRDLIEYDLVGVFSVIESEIQTLLHTYITDKSKTTSSKSRLLDYDKKRDKKKVSMNFH